MSNNPPTIPAQDGRHRRKRRLMGTIAVLVIVVAIGWMVFEHMVDIERHIPQLATTLEQKTGLPTAIGGMSLDLLPFPRIQVRDVQLGAAPFSVRVDSIAFYVQLRPLLRREMRVREVVLRGVDAELPGSLLELRARIAAVAQRATQSAPETMPSSEWDVSVQAVEVVNLAVRQAGATVLRDGDFEAEGLEDLAALTVKGRVELPLFGEGRLGLDGKTVRLRDDGWPLLRTDLDVHDVQVHKLAGAPSMPATVAALGGVLELNGPEELRLDFDGTTQSDNDLFAGQASGRIHRKRADNVLRLDQASWNAPGLDVAGDVVWDFTDDTVTVQSTRSSLTGEALRHLSTRFVPDTIRLDYTTNARATARDIRVERRRKQGWQLVDGAATVGPFNAQWKSGTQLARAAMVELHAVDGAVVLDRFDGSGFTLTGRIRMDDEPAAFQLDLTGHVDAARLWAAAEPALTPAFTKWVTDAQGRLELERLRGTVTKGKLDLGSLDIQASLHNGSLLVKSATFNDTIRAMAVDVTSHQNRLQASVSGESDLLGRIEATGIQHDLEEEVWRADLSLDLARVAQAPPLAPYRDHIRPWLENYGASAFTVSLRPEPERIVVAAARKGLPVLETDLQWPRTDSGVAQLTAHAALDAMAPAGWKTEGIGAAHASWDRESERIEVALDFQNVRVSYNQHFLKEPGVPARLEMDGAPNAPWSWELRLVEERVVGRYEQGQVRASNVLLDLAALDPVLPSLSDMAGTAEGSFHFPAPEAVFTLRGAAIRVTPEVILEGNPAEVRYTEGDWRCRNLGVVCADTRFTVQARRHNGHWTGSVTGPGVDLDALVAALAKLRSDGDGAPGKPDKGAMTARFSAEVDSIQMRDAHIDNVTAELHADSTGIDVRNIRAQPYGGRVTGQVTARDGQVDLDLVLEKVDAKIMDDLFFATRPRRFSGETSGMLKLSFPLGGETDATHTITGRGQLNAANGSLGRLGLATKLLAVLRTTDILLLRLPALRDEGLTFDTFECVFRVDQGRMAVQRADLKSPLFTIQSAGTIDLGADDMEFYMDVHLLDRVLGVADRIPLVGIATREVQKHAALNFVAQGSPASPTIRPRVSKSVQNVREELSRKNPESQSETPNE